MSSFYDRVHDIVTTIPEGVVATYGQIATLAGSPRAARQVGYFLFRSGGAGLPWHRVIAQSGYLTIQHHTCTAELQKKLLEQEYITVTLDTEKGLYKVDINTFLWQP